MRKWSTPIIVLTMFCIGSTDANAKNTPTCDPGGGRTSARIECLAKIVDSLNKQIVELRSNQQRSAQHGDGSGYVKSSELDTFLAGYVKYDTPLAINLVAEPRTGPFDGRCLEAYSDEVGVVARKPCDFEKTIQLKWQLLPASTAVTVH
jgi:hypothetical protein